MSSWNFGGSRGVGADPSGLLDLKALLNQVTGGSLGPVGGLGTAVGSGNRSLGGGSRLQNSSSIYGNHGGCGTGKATFYFALHLLFFLQLIINIVMH